MKQPQQRIAPRSADALDLYVHFPMKVSVFVAVLTVLLSGMYYLDTRSTKETLVFFAASVAAAGAVLAAIYTARTLNLQLAASAAQREMDLRKFALTFAARWNESSMLETRKTCREVVNIKHKGLDEMIAAIGIGPTQDSVINLLNFFEEISISIDERVADERVLYDSFSEVCFQLSATLDGWVTHYRQVRGARQLFRFEGHPRRLGHGDHVDDGGDPGCRRVAGGRRGLRISRTSRDHQKP